MNGEFFILFLGAKIWEATEKVEDRIVFAWKGDGRPAVGWWEDEIVDVQIRVPDYGVVEAKDGCDGGIAGIHGDSGTE